MKERLIKLLGGITIEKHEREMVDLATTIRREMPKLCNVVPECAMQEGHLGGCRDISGLCFSTLHQHELKRKRAERDRKALEELTAKPAGVSQ